MTDDGMPGLQPGDIPFHLKRMFAHSRAAQHVCVVVVVEEGFHADRAVYGGTTTGNLVWTNFIRTCESVRGIVSHRTITSQLRSEVRFIVGSMPEIYFAEARVLQQIAVERMQLQV